MAVSGALAATVGILVLISLANGQTDINKPLPPCSAGEMGAGSPFMAHPNYAQLYIQCSSGNVQNVGLCPEGTIYDTVSNTCNHVAQSTSLAAPCTAANANRQYPATCCESYFRCNGAALELLKCPSGAVFNAQSGTCGQVGQLSGCTDHAQCYRSMPRNPNAPIAPCPLRPVSGNPCLFQIYDNGTLSQPQSCAEGSGLDMNSCTCVSNPSCLRSANSSGAKNPDPLCQASMKVDFNSFQPGTSVPQAYSDKTRRNINEHVEAVGVQYGTGQATLTSNSATGALAYFYLPVFAGNRVANAFVMEITFRATAAGNFEIITNNFNGVCGATFSFNATYNGQNNYQVNGFISGATDVGTTTPVVNTLQVPSLQIQAQTGEFVMLRIIFSVRLQIQLINRGQSGTAQGQIVNSQEYSSIGSYLHYNKCGYQICRGLTGVVKSFLFREACQNTDLYKN
ncbi:hypothetical protein BsWGS_07254 [Bradybaena similaris]